MSGDERVTAVRAAVPRYSAIGGRTWLVYPELDRPGFIHGIVVFRDLHPGTPHEQWTAAVRAYFKRGTRVGDLAVVFCRQVHGAGVGDVINGSVRPGLGPDLDALVTGESSVALAVTVADCLPLFGVGEGGVIGVAHCGWRGIAAGVVEEFAGRVGAGRARFLIGAGIGPCCYEVRDDMLAAFGPDAGRYSVTDGGRTTFDLRRAVSARLLGSGVSADDVLIDDTCTSCKSDVLSSYRAKGPASGRMVAFVASVGGRQAEVMP